MTEATAKRFRLLASVVSLLVLIFLLVGGWFYFRLRSSLPQLDGKAYAAGLGAEVRIERDSLGIPTIHAANRVDAARALGFLHGQDRFFQMDLLRRKGAGELSALFGKGALGLDKNFRRNGFRKRAQEVALMMTQTQREIIQAYTDGVNGGLSSLGAKPFEYYVLRASPEPWKPEDTILVAYAMVLTLSDNVGRHEHTLDTVRSIYGDKALAFFAPLETPDDAAIDGSTAPLAPIPGPDVIDLRKKVALSTPVAPDAFPSTPGSNSLAVSGKHTAQGGALLSNDMHLDLAVPNTWYRAVIVWGDRQLAGFTLPGSPFLIAGSNGKIAWGYTVAGADNGDLVIVTRYPNSELYRVPGSDLKELEKRREVIEVKGSEPVEMVYDWTIWGPIVGQDAQGHALAYHWAEHDAKAVNMGILDIENASSVQEGIDAAHRSGVPPINFLVADSQGHIGWTVSGPLPKRSGFDGRLPNEWAYGDRHWDGFQPPDKIPSVIDPADGLLWTANNRIIGGEGLKVLGDGGYMRPARAAQIRDDLRQLIQEKPTDVRPADLLKIELDDRALLLARWRTLLLDSLTQAALAGHPDRTELKEKLGTWSGRADTESVSYGLVREFHSVLAGKVLNPIFARCKEVDPAFSYGGLDWEAALRVLVQERPVHLLSPEYKTWNDVILSAADQVIAESRKSGGLDSFAWGKHNVLHMVHPFSLVMPAWLTNSLNMPKEPMDGDDDMPRVLKPSFGASERFAVSPGREDQGVCEMPGGESGHPLSPYYRAGHEAWVHGEPTPFMPGKTEHTLLLEP